MFTVGLGYLVYSYPCRVRFLFFIVIDSYLLLLLPIFKFFYGISDILHLLYFWKISRFML